MEVTVRRTGRLTRNKPENAKMKKKIVKMHPLAAGSITANFGTAGELADVTDDSKHDVVIFKAGF